LIDVRAVRAMARAAHRFVLAIGNFIGMAGLFRRAMDYLYLVCVIVGCTALVLISAVIPWAVFTRYVLNSAASWPEPMAVLLTIVLTFIGAAAGYRLNLHMNVSYFADQLPAKYRRLLDLIVQLLMALIAIFMIVWGERLVEVTWYNTIADFPFLSVGVTYLPIPIGGAVTLLFITERLLIGPPPQRTDWREAAPD
jgi:TRAP-type C4-dicarboxylate transport system permease small subunit